MDFEYFKFTSKRTTADLFITDGLEKDLLHLIPSFLKDFWYIAVLAILFFLTVRWLYQKIERLSIPSLKVKEQILIIIPLFALYFIGFRGGVQYRPLNVIQASQYAKAQNIPLVLNTPFTIIKSSYKENLKVKKFFEEDELASVYSPLLHFKQDSIVKELNVVVLILESFSKEYIGALNKDNKSYTPFLDKLIQESLCFPNGFANGKKSIEGLPAILSSIPTLMNTAYISSKYGSNSIQSLPSFLKERGYETAFYHGGENGTMGFNSFSDIAGIARYVGRDQYPKQSDYDGNWGIFDEPFLQFTIEDMSKMKEPFFSGIFTLSSHHPYTVPSQHEGKFEEGPIPILKTISYADYALKQFFETAKQQTWFKNTLFVITADHTQQNFREEYNNSVGRYRVPLLYYSPAYIQPKIDSTIAQQNDIFPSVVDFIGYEGDIIAFGNSAFSKNKQRFAVSYLNGIYQLISKDYYLLFDGENPIALYKLDAASTPSKRRNLMNSETEKLLELENLLKGIIQQYQQRLTTNSLLPS